MQHEPEARKFCFKKNKKVLIAAYRSVKFLYLEHTFFLRKKEEKGGRGTGDF